MKKVTKTKTKKTKTAAKPKKTAIKKTSVKKTPAKKSAPKKAASVVVWKRERAGRPKASEPKPVVKKAKKAPTAQKTVVRKPKRVTRRQIEDAFVKIHGEILGKVEIPQEQINSERSITETKFHLGPKENAGEFQTHNIPFEYGKNRIVLLVVDPKFVFLYWEVQNDKMHEAISRIGHGAKLTLRFRELDTSHSWDISIYERVGNWYLKLDHPEQHLAVDIGMKNDRGEFYRLASSMPMKLPRMGLARPGPIKWMLVSPDGQKVITEIEEYTDADYELLKKILGPYFFDLLKKGKFAGIAGSSAENVFTELSEIRSMNISS